VEAAEPANSSQRHGQDAGDRTGTNFNLVITNTRLLFFGNRLREVDPSRSPMSLTMTFNVRRSGASHIRGAHARSEMVLAA